MRTRLNCAGPVVLFIFAMILFAIAYLYVSSQGTQHRSLPNAPTTDGYYD